MIPASTVDQKPVGAPYEATRLARPRAACQHGEPQRPALALAHFEGQALREVDACHLLDLLARRPVLAGWPLICSGIFCTAPVSTSALSSTVCAIVSALAELKVVPAPRQQRPTSDRERSRTRRAARSGRHPLVQPRIPSDFRAGSATVSQPRPKRKLLGGAALRWWSSDPHSSAARPHWTECACHQRPRHR